MSKRPLILVVDDDAPILLLMKTLLREFGYEPVTAASGAEALEQAKSQPPDLILLDWKMPEMSGEEVLRELRSESSLATVPVVILSGEPVERDELARIGAVAAVLKPFDVPTLIDKIKMYLSGVI